MINVDKRTNPKSMTNHPAWFNLNSRLQPVMMFKRNVSERQLLLIEIVISLVFCLMPLLFNNPYRLNIFLSWEGAYRLSIGQIPFRDFSLPMGYGYWVIPAIFFRIFGPYMYTLIISQVFINLVSILAFRSILRKLNVQPVVILLSVIVFCFSYVSWNFWPWYNHLVIVLGFIAVYFAIAAVFQNTVGKLFISLGLSGFFILFSFFTKQDGGALTMFIVYGILIYDAIIEKQLKKLAIFTGSILFWTAVFVLPFLPYDFLYWFNYGQAPHDSRIHTINFLNDIVGWSYWQKFFLLVIILVALDKARSVTTFFRDKQEFLFAYLCAAVIGMSMIIQVTSHEPPNGEVFFYAFGFAFCISHLRLNYNLSDWRYLATAMALVVFWWSGIYWRNIQRVISKKPVVLEKAKGRTNHKYRLATEFKSMNRLFLAESTIEGIKRIKAMEEFNNNPGVKVLNMSELTSLAYEIPFTPLTNQPMWFHQGVSIFQKEVDEFCARIANNEYDVVLFESIPVNEVINFYPADVQACLDEHYKFEFTFLAPRTPEESFIHVYKKRSAAPANGQ
jgi:hypothetical protein